MAASSAPLALPPLVGCRAAPRRAAPAPALPSGPLASSARDPALTSPLSRPAPRQPYAYNALEPHIDEATMKVHHTGHHQAYTVRPRAPRPRVRGIKARAHARARATARL